MSGKYKAYPEYKDSGVEWLGEVPGHWGIYSFKRSIYGCINGIWGKDPDGIHNIVVLRVADFDRQSFLISDEKLTQRSILPTDREKRLLKKGDLLIEKSGGGDKTLVGCVILFDKEYVAVTSNFVAKMSPTEKYSSNFLKYAFSHTYAGNINYKSIKQTTGIQNIDSDAYLIEQFSFPLKIEQTQIAAFLDHETTKIDNLIEKQQQLIELLKERRQAVISHAVTKGLNPDVPMKHSGVEWLGKVPECWNNIAIKYVATLNPSKSCLSSERAKSTCSFIPMEKLKLNSIILDEVRNVNEIYNGYTYFEDGDVLIAKVTPCFENKNMAIASDLSNGLGFGSSEINVLRCNDQISNFYLFYRLQEDNFMALGEGSMIGAGGLKRVPSEILNNFIIALPLKHEQENICSFLEHETAKIDTLIELQQQQIELLKERRTALISAAVTGKIDVRDWQVPVTQTESDEVIA